MGRGRPQGSRNKITSAMVQLLDQSATAVVAKCIHQAVKGDHGSQRLVIDLILGEHSIEIVRGDRLVSFSGENPGEDLFGLAEPGTRGTNVGQVKVANGLLFWSEKVRITVIQSSYQTILIFPHTTLLAFMLEFG
jgi:hypothetical protein